jgi:hypothetical protein
MFREKRCREIKTHIWCSVISFSENRAVYVIMWEKYKMRFCFYTATMVTRTRQQCYIIRTWLMNPSMPATSKFFRYVSFCHQNYVCTSVICWFHCSCSQWTWTVETGEIPSLICFPLRRSFQEPKIHVSIILPSTPRSTKWSVPIRLTLRALRFLHVCDVPPDRALRKQHVPLNFGVHLPHYAVSNSRRTRSESAQPLKSQISHARMYDPCWHIFIVAKCQHGGLVKFVFIFVFASDVD